MMSRKAILGGLAALIILLGAGAFLLTTDDDDPAAPATETIDDADIDLSAQRPAPSAREAVERLLAADSRGNHEASFHLLSSAGLQAHPDAESWGRRRIEFPAITTFRVDSVDGDTVVVDVEHEPGLDPFVGLSAARETQRWTAQEVDGGWLVDPEPEITMQLPDDSGAEDAAVRWTRALQQCDQAATEAEQVLPDLLGVSAGASQICGTDDPVDVSEPRRVEAGTSAADLVGQYGDAALDWARAVPVRVGGVQVIVVLAPIGDEWRVVSVVDG